MVKTCIFAIPEATLQRERQIARQALADPSGWRHHGLGMLQKYLPDGDRIHLWHPELIRTPKDINAHTHRFDMESHVLAGVMGHEEVIVRPGSDYIVAEQHAEHTVVLNERVSIETIPMTIPAGYGYLFPRDTYHFGETNGTIITYVRRTNIMGVSRSLSKVGFEPVAGHTLNFPDEDIPKFLNEALSAIG